MLCHIQQQILQLVFFYTLTIKHVLTVPRSIRSPIGEPYYVFGIGSSCYHRQINESTQFNLKARYHDKAVHNFLLKYDNNHPVFKHLRKYNYNYIDVCPSGDSNSTNIIDNITSISIDLLLNPKYTLTEDPSLIARRKISRWEYRSKILVIFLYLEHDPFRLFSELFSQTDVLIFNVHNDDVFPQNFFMIPGRTQVSFRTLDRLVRIFFGVMQWKHVTMILLEEPYGVGYIHFMRLREMFHDLGVCFNTEVKSSIFIILYIHKISASIRSLNKLTRKLNKKDNFF